VASRKVQQDRKARARNSREEEKEKKNAFFLPSRRTLAKDKRKREVLLAATCEAIYEFT